MTTFPTRMEMEKQFSKAFTPEQTTSLVDVIDTIRQAELQREADTQELKRGLTELTGEVRKLTEAQQRTDKRLGQFQQRTDERFAELAAAQQRTDKTMEKLAAAQQRTDKTMEKLAAAQQRTEEKLGRLSETVQDMGVKMERGFAELRQTVGSLANTFGFSLEEFTAALLPPYLEKHGGITELALERSYFEANGGWPAEVDLVGRGQRAGQPVLVLAECRTTLGGGEMRRIANKLEAIAATVTDREVVKIVVAMNLHPTGAEAAEETGIWAIPYSRINRERD